MPIRFMKNQVRGSRRKSIDSTIKSEPPRKKAPPTVAEPASRHAFSFELQYREAGNVVTARNFGRGFSPVSSVPTMLTGPECQQMQIRCRNAEHFINRINKLSFSEE